MLVQLPVNEHMQPCQGGFLLRRGEIGSNVPDEGIIEEGFLIVFAVLQEVCLLHTISFSWQGKQAA